MVDAQQGDPVWRQAEDGRRITLVATDAAFNVLGIGADDHAASDGAAKAGGGAAEEAPTPTSARVKAGKRHSGEDDAELRVLSQPTSVLKIGKSATCVATATA